MMGSVAKVDSNLQIDACGKWSQLPAALKSLNNWLLWRKEIRDGKPTKVPYQASGSHALLNNPKTWTSFEAAIDALADGFEFDGIGCVIAPPYVGIDLDHCRDSKTGTVQPWADEIVKTLDSYSELSPSGDGIHIWVQAKMPEGGNRAGHSSVEIYGDKRYFTVTGQHIEGTPLAVNSRDAELAEVHRKFVLEARNNSPVATGQAIGDNRTREEDPSRDDFAVACDAWRAVWTSIGKDATEGDAQKWFVEHANPRPKLRRTDYVVRTIKKAKTSLNAEADAQVKEPKKSAPKPKSPEQKSAPTPEPQAKVIVETFNNIEAKPLIWLWRDRIPKAKLTVFAGNPDCGKSTIAIDVISRYTTATDFPDGAPNPCGGGEVLMLLAEDDPSDTVKPRLLAAGADVSRVHYLRGIQIQDGAKKRERALALDTDLGLLEAEFKKRPNIGLVVIDPLSSYFGKADMNKEQEIRRVLDPLKALAERSSVTFIGILHFSKRTDVSAIHKVGGAVAMSGSPRALWLFAQNPEREGEYLMLLGKGNLAKKRTGLRYRFGDKELPTGSAPFIVWGEEVSANADSILDTAQNPVAKQQAKAERFLTDALADGEEHPSDDLMATAKAEGISPRTMYRAKQDLGVKARQHDRAWWWQAAGDIGRATNNLPDSGCQHLAL